MSSTSLMTLIPADFKVFEAASGDLGIRDRLSGQTTVPIPASIIACEQGGVVERILMRLKSAVDSSPRGFTLSDPQRHSLRMRPRIRLSSPFPNNRLTIPSNNHRAHRWPRRQPSQPARSAKSSARSMKFMYQVCNIGTYVELKESSAKNGDWHFRLPCNEVVDSSKSE